MRAHSGNSGRIQDVLNILNARAFRTKSGRGPDFLNILNARPFRICRTPPECKRIQDIQDAFRISGISGAKGHFQRQVNYARFS